MKCTVETKALIERLKPICANLPESVSIRIGAIYNGIEIQAPVLEDEECTSGIIYTKISASTEEYGAAAVSARKLLEVAQKAQKVDALVTLETPIRAYQEKNFGLVATFNRSTYTLLKTEKCCPPIPMNSDGIIAAFTISATEFKHAVNQATAALNFSKKASFIHQCLHFKVRGDSLEVQGSCTIRLATVTCTIKNPFQTDADLYIHSDTLKPILACAKDEVKVGVDKSDPITKIRFVSNGVILDADSMEKVIGNYPDFSRYIPENFSTATVNKQDFIKALTAVNVMAKENVDNAVLIKFVKDKQLIEFKGYSPNGVAETCIDAEVAENAAVLIDTRNVIGNLQKISTPNFHVKAEDGILKICDEQNNGKFVAPGMRSLNVTRLLLFTAFNKGEYYNLQMADGESETFCVEERVDEGETAMVTFSHEGEETLTVTCRVELDFEYHAEKIVDGYGISGSSSGFKPFKVESKKSKISVYRVPQVACEISKPIKTPTEEKLLAKFVIGKTYYIHSESATEDGSEYSLPMQATNRAENDGQVTVTFHHETHNRDYIFPVEIDYDANAEKIANDNRYSMKGTANDLAADTQAVA